jgi:hypothetical protein
LSAMSSTRRGSRRARTRASPRPLLPHNAGETDGAAHGGLPPTPSCKGCVSRQSRPWRPARSSRNHRSVHNPQCDSAWMATPQSRYTAAIRAPCRTFCGGRRDIQKNFAGRVAEVRASLAPGTSVEVWFQDEMRVGQKNARDPRCG